MHCNITCVLSSSSLDINVAIAWLFHSVFFLLLDKDILMTSVVKFDSIFISGHRKDIRFVQSEKSFSIPYCSFLRVFVDDPMQVQLLL